MQADEITATLPDEQALIDQLRADPNFFVRHPGLLSELNLPHASGNAVSLVEHQVSILRARNMEMRRRLHTLVATARDNDRIFAVTRSLTLALLEVSSTVELNEVLATHLLLDLEADFVCAHLPGDGPAMDHIQFHPDGIPGDGLLDTQAANCLILRQQELAQLFPMAEPSPTGSAVILPLVQQEMQGEAQQLAGNGVLCIGSRDPGHFTPDMDTLFVAFIADVLGRTIPRLSTR